MKALTHDIFSLGVGLYLVLHLEHPPALAHLLLVVWLAFVTNWLIDALGHVTGGIVPVRSFWTHSFFTAPALGVIAALPSIYFAGIITGQTLTAYQAFFAAGLGAVLAYSHLLLDALTEGGVYLVRRRVALAHMRYDNQILNGAFAAIGLLLVFAAFF